MNNFEHTIEQVSIQSLYIVGNIEDAIQPLFDANSITLLDEISNCLIQDENNVKFNLAIGIWTILAAPKYSSASEKLNYNNLTLSQKLINQISKGLLSVAEYSVIDSQKENEIDYHYDACRWLNYILKDHTEDIILQRISKYPDIKSLSNLVEAIDTLSVLRNKLKPSTIKCLKDFLGSPDINIFLSKSAQDSVSRLLQERL